MTTLNLFLFSISRYMHVNGFKLYLLEGATDKRGFDHLICFVFLGLFFLDFLSVCPRLISHDLQFSGNLCWVIKSLANSLVADCIICNWFSVKNKSPVSIDWTQQDLFSSMSETIDISTLNVLKSTQWDCYIKFPRWLLVMYLKCIRCSSAIGPLYLNTESEHYLVEQFLFWSQ